jgi:glycosyltransferase involved in cell wall biosynthesis
MQIATTPSDLKIKLTIISVCYNAEAFIQFTIDSILKQTNQNFEYLIVDGASKDKTLATIDANKSSFLNLNLISEKDNGLYDAMNKAQNLAKGDYIWFMNAGDEIADENCVENILQEIDNQADVIISDTIYLNENRVELGLRSQLTPHKIPENLNWRNFKFGMKICHQSFIVKKSLAIPYSINNLSADLDWEISILKKAQKIKLIENPLSKYLLGGLSKQKHQESLNGRFLVLQNHFGFLPNLFNHCWILIRMILFKLKMY